MTDVAIDPGNAPRPLRPGELIGSRYRLECVAGSGGMATVWRAYDERLQRPVAIKVISDALANDPAAVARFAREARTHAGIQHPNLVNVYDYSVTAAQPYLVMEYIAGSTLSERLDRGGFPAAAIQTLAAELLSAIACVHDHGVLHRDIKPGNVLLDHDGHARLTDFGLARLEDSTQITRMNEIVGTLRFLAPELIDGKQASKQSDLYALGVLLRTAVEGAASSGGRQQQEHSGGRQQQEYSGGQQQLERSRGPQCAEPPGDRFEKLITWLTEHDPRGRPRDAHAALAALPKMRQVQPRRHGSRNEDEPTTVLPLRHRHRYTTGNRLRSRAAAASALLAAAAGTALVVIDAAGFPAHDKPIASAKPTASAKRTGQGRQTRVGTTSHTGGASAKRARTGTIDQRLQHLAADVRRAARP